MFTEEYNDDMHKLIVDRLKERNRKLEIINSCEKPSRKTFLVPAFGVLAAACFVGFIFFLSPSISDDSIEPCRSGMEDVQRLMDAKDYNKALDLVEKEISSVDSILNLLRIQDKNADEETLYEIQSQELKRENLIKDRETLKKMLK